MSPNPKAQRALESCLTVKGLIEQLQGCDPDLPVVFKYPYGDRGRNDVAGAVEAVAEETVVWSDYHNNLKIPSASDGDPDEHVDVVVIS